jgi:hypothetical protein
MELFFIIVLAAILFGPIVWVFTFGRHRPAPHDEDARGASGYGWLIRRILTIGRR